jgi:hypothetical protein
MPPRKQVGLGAMRQIRQELKEATDDRRDLDLRIKRLRTAEAALHGGPSPNAKVLNREMARGYLAENPGSKSLEMADALRVPVNNMRTLLTAMKKSKEVRNEDQRWYLREGADQRDPREKLK